MVKNLCSPSLSKKMLDRSSMHFKSHAMSRSILYNHLYKFNLHHVDGGNEQ